MRQSPDVILVGEMRDPETIATVLTAAETGLQSMLGRGKKCFSRLSVCRSMTPGIRTSPSRSSPTPQAPRSMAAILPSTTRTEPRKASSPVTTMAFL